MNARQSIPDHEYDQVTVEGWAATVAAYNPGQVIVHVQGGTRCMGEDVVTVGRLCREHAVTDEEREMIERGDVVVLADGARVVRVAP